MARKTRTTTSVSTLVNQIVQLRTIAKVANRKDLDKELHEIHVRIANMAKEYVDLRKAIQPFVKSMLNVEIDISLEVDDDVEDEKVA